MVCIPRLPRGNESHYALSMERGNSTAKSSRCCPALRGWSIQLAEKLSIDGLKLSLQLAQINLAANPVLTVAALFRILAKERINMSLVCLDTMDDSVLAGACCIPIEDLPRAEAVLNDFREQITVIAPVGIVTIFPHRARLVLLGTVLKAFAEAGLTVHALATSLSSLSFSMDYLKMEQALAVLQSVAELPANHAPYRPEFRVRQI
jgi:aspartokinase